MKAVNIVWDTDEEKCTLPSEVEISADVSEEDIPDFLSDKYGFCVESYNVAKNISPENIINMRKLKPCRYCKGTNIKMETWSSGAYMCMVKCNNPDCPVPPEGYPTGRDPEKVKEEWNKRQGQ